jgi:alpha-ketoglutarate-dependent taurine dioxygenase
MTKPITILEVSSSNNAYNLVDKISTIYKDTGILVLRGHSFSLEEQLHLTKLLGDIFTWNVFSDAPKSALDSAVYYGGHSDSAEKEYNQGPEEYVLDWHIEQVYYTDPILAGIWNMTSFTADKASGNTRFVDSIELLNTYSQEDRDFLLKSVVKWDKPAPLGTGPFYTKAVDRHPVTGDLTLRVETDQGCYLMPELVLYDGAEPTQVQIDRLASLLGSIKDKLNNDESIRYVQSWEQGDLLIVDLFRMYHSVMGGFTYGQRKFTGVGLRPRIYDNGLYDSLEKL